MTQSVYAYTITSVNYTEDLISSIFGVFTPKQSLLRENQALRSKLQEMQVADLYTKALEIENADLRKLPLSVSTAEIIARIIDYRYIPYGTLLVKVENSKQLRVQPNALAHFGTLAIGKVVRINNNIFTIKLFTSSDVAYDVLVGDIIGTSIGMSNGVSKIMLPRTYTVALGTVVTLPSAGGLVLGAVESIDRDAEDSLQTIFIKMPINIKDLRFITIDNQ